MGFKLILTVVWPWQYIMKIAFALLTSRTLRSKRFLVPSMSIASVHPILIWQYLSFKMRGWGDKKTTIPWDEVCCGPRNKQRKYRKYLSFKMSDGWETTFYNTMSIPWGEVCCGPRNKQRCHRQYLSFKISNDWKTTFDKRMTLTIPWGEVCCGPRNKRRCHRLQSRRGVVRSGKYLSEPATKSNSLFVLWKIWWMDCEI